MSPQTRVHTARCISSGRAGVNEWDWMNLDPCSTPDKRYWRRRGRGWSLCFGGHIWLSSGPGLSGSRIVAWGVQQARGFSGCDCWPHSTVVLCASCGMNQFVTPSYSCSFTRVLSVYMCPSSVSGEPTTPAYSWCTFIVTVWAACKYSKSTPVSPSPAPLGLAALPALAGPSLKNVNLFCNCMQKIPQLACRSTAPSSARSCLALGAQK